MILFGQWLQGLAVPVIGLLAFLAMLGAASVGSVIRRHREKVLARDGRGESASLDGSLVSAVLGLLALLLGFTFALAVDRFETRRGSVLAEANAIGTGYLYAQLLDEPHRSRLSKLLVDYTENRVELGLASPERAPQLLVLNDALVVDLWSATTAAFDSVRSTPLGAALPQAISRVIDLDTERKAARQARVPSEVFVVLLIYIVVTAGMLGYSQVPTRRMGAGVFLFALMVMSLMLIMDIDRPTGGGINESQEPMVRLRDTLRTQPPGTFDRWREPG